MDFCRGKSFCFTGREQLARNARLTRISIASNGQILQIGSVVLAEAIFGMVEKG